MQVLQSSARIVPSVTLMAVAALCAAASGCATFLGELATETGPRSCPPTVQKTLKYPATTFPITYVEPTKQLNGEDILKLSHTTIYVDFGDGAQEYTKHSATRLQGGGTVTREITLPLEPNQEVTVKICVTATNSAGEGPPSL